MKKKDALQGTLDLLVLRVLGSNPELHGYGIMSKIQLLSADALRVEEGSLYPALHRMEQAGWLRAKWVINDNGRRVRGYRLTVAGRRQAETEVNRWQAVTDAVARVVQETN